MPPKFRGNIKDLPSVPSTSSQQSSPLFRCNSSNANGNNNYGVQATSNATTAAADLTPNTSGGSYEQQQQQQQQQQPQATIPSNSNHQHRRQEVCCSSSSSEWIPHATHAIAVNVKRVNLDAPNTYEVVKTVVDRDRAERELQHYNTKPRHPGVIMYKLFKRLKGGGAQITMEYANRGTLKEVEERLAKMFHAQKEFVQKSLLPDDVTSNNNNSNDALHEAAEDNKQQKEQHQQAPSTLLAEKMNQLRQEQRKIRHDLAKSVARQVLDALLYYRGVHNRWHRDVKPDNFLCRKDGTLKLADFDVSRSSTTATTIAGGAAATTTSTAGNATATFAAGPGAKTGVGTFTYMAPEYKAKVEDPGIADIWSLGCVLFEILNDTNLFPPHPSHPVGDADAVGRNASVLSKPYRVSSSNSSNATETLGTVPFPDRGLFDLPDDKEIAEMDARFFCPQSAWCIVDDPQLRMLLRRCLVFSPKERATILEACALTYLFDEHVKFVNEQQLLQQQQQQQQQRDSTPSSSSDLSSSQLLKITRSVTRIADDVFKNELLVTDEAKRLSPHHFEVYGMSAKYKELFVKQQAREKNDDDGDEEGDEGDDDNNNQAETPEDLLLPQQPQHPLDNVLERLHKSGSWSSNKNAKLFVEMATKVKVIMKALVREMTDFRKCVNASKLTDFGFLLAPTGHSHSRTDDDEAGTSSSRASSPSSSTKTNNDGESKGSARKPHPPTTTTTTTTTTDADLLNAPSSMFVTSSSIDDITAMKNNALGRVATSFSAPKTPNTCLMLMTRTFPTSFSRNNAVEKNAINNGMDRTSNVVNNNTNDSGCAEAATPKSVLDQSGSLATPLKSFATGKQHQQQRQHLEVFNSSFDNFQSMAPNNNNNNTNNNTNNSNNNNYSINNNSNLGASSLRHNASVSSLATTSNFGSPFSPRTGTTMTNDDDGDAETINNNTNNNNNNNIPNTNDEQQLQDGNVSSYDHTADDPATPYASSASFYAANQEIADAVLKNYNYVDRTRALCDFACDEDRREARERMEALGARIDLASRQIHSVLDTVKAEKAETKDKLTEEKALVKVIRNSVGDDLRKMWTRRGGPALCTMREIIAKSDDFRKNK